MSRNISLHFTEEEHNFILNTAAQYLHDGGVRISKGAILRSLVRLLQQLEVDVSGVKVEDQLLQRLQDAVKKDLLNRSGQPTKPTFFTRYGFTFN